MRPHKNEFSEAEIDLDNARTAAEAAEEEFSALAAQLTRIHSLLRYCGGCTTAVGGRSTQGVDATPNGSTASISSWLSVPTSWKYSPSNRTSWMPNRKISWRDRRRWPANGTWHTSKPLPLVAKPKRASSFAPGKNVCARPQEESQNRLKIRQGSQARIARRTPSTTACRSSSHRRRRCHRRPRCPGENPGTPRSCRSGTRKSRGSTIRAKPNYQRPGRACRHLPDGKSATSGTWHTAKSSRWRNGVCDTTIRIRAIEILA